MNSTRTRRNELTRRRLCPDRHNTTSARWIPSGRFAYTEKRSIPAGRCGHRPLRSSIERALSKFHTSNIQRAQMRRPARRIVRLGNLIGQPPEGRSLRDAPSVNGIQKQNAFSGATALFRTPAPLFSPFFSGKTEKNGPSETHRAFGASEWAAGGPQGRILEGF